MNWAAAHGAVLAALVLLLGAGAAVWRNVWWPLAVAVPLAVTLAALWWAWQMTRGM